MVWFSTQTPITDERIAGAISRNTVGKKLYPFVDGGAEDLAGLTEADLDVSYDYGDLFRYGAVIGADCTLAFERARDVVEVDHSIEILLPRGRCKVLTTILFSGAVSTQDPDATLAARVTIRGQGIDSVIEPLMVDGSPALDFQHSDWAELLDFRVDTTERVNVGGGPRNCTGIRFQQYGSRSYIKNVHVWGCAIGWDVKGFIIRSPSMWASHCTVAFNFDTINASKLCISGENNVKTMTLVNSTGVHFDNYQDEGILYTGSGDPIPSTIDNCTNIVVTAPRFEGKAVFNSANPRPTPFFRVGFTTPCKRIAFNNVQCAVGNDVYNHYLEFDQVDGVEVTGFFDSFETHGAVLFTANCKNIEYKPTYSKTGIFPVGEPTGFPVDDSGTLGRVVNYWPNSNFDLWLRGWDGVIVSAAAIAQENANVRNGVNALRVTATAAGFNVVQFRIAGAAVTALQGKTCTLGVWMYVPDIAAFDDADTTAQTARAGIVLTSDGGPTASPTQNNHTMKGHWQFVNVDAVIGAAATYIEVSIYVNQSATVMVGTEYIIIDGVYLFEGDSDSNSDKFLNGHFTDSPLVMSSAVNGKLVQRTDVTPADVDQVYEIGDRIEYLTPVAAGSLGEVCTTAGVGGTAVFKTYGAIAP